MAVPERPVVFETGMLLGAQPVVLYGLGLNFSGTGYLAGSAPAGITTIDAAPASCEVRVHLRADRGTVHDGALVATTNSAADGTWIVEGLNPRLRFDVIARRPGYRDVIMSDVAPYIASSTQTVVPKGHIAYSIGQSPFGHVAVG